MAQLSITSSMAVAMECMILRGCIGASGCVKRIAYPVSDTAAEVDFPRPAGHQPDSDAQITLT